MIFKENIKKIVLVFVQDAPLSPVCLLEEDSAYKDFDSDADQEYSSEDGGLVCIDCAELLSDVKSAYADGEGDAGYD